MMCQVPMHQKQLSLDFSNWPASFPPCSPGEVFLFPTPVTGFLLLCNTCEFSLLSRKMRCCFFSSGHQGRQQNTRAKRQNCCTDHTWVKCQSCTGSLCEPQSPREGTVVRAKCVKNVKFLAYKKVILFTISGKRSLLHYKCTTSF